jgi:hypothetical protein
MKLDSLLEARTDTKPAFSKVKALARQTQDGALSSFAGLFKVGKLSDKDVHSLESILIEYKDEDMDIAGDLASLSAITCEIKAIHHQAALLHGERIKRADALLKRYRNGAFTAWLLSTYGNRQTPYNFLVYYEFHEALPATLKPEAEALPRQVIYTLASRNAPQDKKYAFLHRYAGKTKDELLELIRTSFPLDSSDERKSETGQAILTNLVKSFCSYQRLKSQIDPGKKKEIKKALTRFLEII